jgi:hypothetical protein
MSSGATGTASCRSAGWSGLSTRQLRTALSSLQIGQNVAVRARLPLLRTSNYAEAEMANAATVRRIIIIHRYPLQAHLGFFVRSGLVGQSQPAVRTNARTTAPANDAPVHHLIRERATRAKSGANLRREGCRFKCIFRMDTGWLEQVSPTFGRGFKVKKQVDAILCVRSLCQIP